MCHNKVEDTFIHNKLHSFAACTWARWIAILDRGVLWLQRKPWQNEVLSPQATAVESQRTSQQYTASVPLCFLYAVLQVFVDLWSGVFEVVLMMMVQCCPSISDHEFIFFVQALKLSWRRQRMIQTVGGFWYHSFFPKNRDLQFPHS